MGKIRGVYGKPLEAFLNLKVSEEMLNMIGQAIVKRISDEAKKDFAKRGWSGEDPMNGPPVWNSFSYRIKQSSIEILSTFYGMRELTTGDIPERRMTWLTQKGAGRVGSVSTSMTVGAGAGVRPVYKKGKKPLVIPIENEVGEIIFRTAPLQLKDAWIHPGIAKFTFVQRAINKAREDCRVIMAGEVRKKLTGG